VPVYFHEDFGSNEVAYEKSPDGPGMNAGQDWCISDIAEVVAFAARVEAQLRKFRLGGFLPCLLRWHCWHFVNGGSDRAQSCAASIHGVLAASHAGGLHDPARAG